MSSEQIAAAVAGDQALARTDEDLRTGLKDVRAELPSVVVLGLREGPRQRFGEVIMRERRALMRVGRATSAATEDGAALLLSLAPKRAGGQDGLRARPARPVGLPRRPRRRSAAARPIGSTATSSTSGRALTPARVVPTY